jgi:uncharacterized protein
MAAYRRKNDDAASRDRGALPTQLGLVLMVICCRLAVARSFGLFALCLACWLAWSGASRADAALEPLVIVSSGTRHAFEVEVMRTEAERARGLMFRRYMPPERGMLFDFKVAAPVSMWMKDTFIPLDMLFIRADGAIARIAANADPMSTRIISSGEPVLAVLELNGGTAARLNLKQGDKVEHKMFEQGAVK